MKAILGKSEIFKRSGFSDPLSSNNHVPACYIMFLGFQNILGASRIQKGLISEHFVWYLHIIFYHLLRRLPAVQPNGRLREAIFGKSENLQKSGFSDPLSSKVSGDQTLLDSGSLKYVLKTQTHDIGCENMVIT